MQLSLKGMAFSQLTSTFSKCKLSFKHFQKKIYPHS